jgi:hypothetical protein
MGANQPCVRKPINNMASMMTLLISGSTGLIFFYAAARGGVYVGSHEFIEVNECACMWAFVYVGLWFQKIIIREFNLK